MKPIGLTGDGDPPLDQGRSEQGKLPTAKEFMLAERDKHMSEQETPKSSYMQELDQWIETQVIEALQEQWSRAQDGDMTATAEPIKKAIREKVLESYHNGLKAAKAKQWPRRYK